MKSKISIVLILMALLILSFPRADMAEELGFSLPVLPDDLFSKDVVPEPCPHNESIIPKRYMIYWNDAPATDGAFVLVIHPSQIFLISSHDNPNPNSIYWFSDLSIVQYEELIFYLDNYDGDVFSDKNVWNWGGYKVFNYSKSMQSDDAKNADGNDRCKIVNNVIRENMSGVFTELNRGMSVDVDKLQFIQSEISIMRGVYIGEKPVKVYLNKKE